MSKPLRALVARLAHDPLSWIELDDELEELLVDATPPLLEAWADELTRAEREGRRHLVRRLSEHAGELGAAVIPVLCARATWANAAAFADALEDLVVTGDLPADREDDPRFGLEVLEQGCRQLGQAAGERAEAIDRMLRQAAPVNEPALQRLLAASALPLARCLALCGGGPVDAAHAARAAADQDERVRAELAAQAHREEVPEAVVGTLAADPSPQVRAALAVALGSRDAGAAWLERLARDPDLAVAAAAAAALGRDDAQERLGQALRAAPWQRRLAISASASALPEERALEVLSELELEGAPQEVERFLRSFVPGREQAEARLARLAQRTEHPALARAAFDTLSSLERAEAVLESLAQRHLPAEVRRLAFEALSDLPTLPLAVLSRLLVPDEPLLSDLFGAFQHAFEDDPGPAERRFLEGLLAHGGELERFGSAILDQGSEGEEVDEDGEGAGDDEEDPGGETR